MLRNAMEGVVVFDSRYFSITKIQCYLRCEGFGEVQISKKKHYVKLNGHIFE